MRALAAGLLLLQLGAVAWAEDIGSSSSIGGVSPSGTFTAGDLVVGGPGTTQVQDASALTTGYANLGGMGIYTNKNIAMVTTGAGVTSPQNSAFVWHGNSVGGSCSNYCLANEFFANSWAVNSGAAASTHSTMTRMYANFGGAGQSGGFEMLDTTLFINATTGNTTNAFYQTLNAVSAATVNDNGTMGTASGSLFTAGWYANLRNGATFWAENSGVELDLANDTGSSVLYSYGFHFVLASAAGNTVSPSIEEIAFDASSGASPNLGTVSIAYGIGAYSGYSPMSTTGTIMGCAPHAGAGNCVNSAGSSTVGYGIDFSKFTFTNFAFRSTGWSVDGSGNEIAAQVTTPTVLGSAAGGTLALGVDGSHNGIDILPTTSSASPKITTSANALYLASASGAVFLADSVYGEALLAGVDGNAATLGNTDYFSFHGLASGSNAVYLVTAGIDARIDMRQSCKGTNCTLDFAANAQSPNNGNNSFRILGTASQTAYLTVNGSTGTTPTLGCVGTNCGPVIIPNGTGVIALNGPVEFGSSAAVVASIGEVAFAKISASGTAPNAGFLKIEATAGTNAGTCKVIAYAGTSTTPVTIVDNVGTGC